MKQQTKVNDIILMASGAVMLLFSFLSWIKVEDESLANAWSSEGDGLDVLPLFTYVPLAGLIIAGLTAARVFGGSSLPAEVGGFTIPQLVKALSVATLLLVLGIFVLVPDDLDAGIGLFLSILGAIGLVVGSFLPDGTAVGSSGPSNQPPTPF